ncbi:MAG: peptidoglycan-binding protein [Coriobacteriia bacterium]|nr:peptidoglycan-binding protein [Coriobacteriia bacterium]MCL2870870.1 peptidoglycan-binding protein [Coriobacteriia bacterium]
MKPIKYKDKGSAVEDIQRRLRVLGYALGAEGNSAEFLDDTLAAVSAFQRAKGIESTGAVGPRTWSALVDSTFELGDRMLYLRMPYFHGADVIQLQHALNSLGFVTGGADGIFGVSTEHAVTEFQTNYNINPDGLVGNNTLRALLDLRHMWGGKEGRAHSSVQGVVPQQYQALANYYFDFQANSSEKSVTDAATSAALRRLVRYANNLEDAARADLAQAGAIIPAITVLVRVGCGQEGDEDVNASTDTNTNGSAGSTVIYQNDFKSFKGSLGAVAKDLQALKNEGPNSSDRQEIQIPSYELKVIIPSQLLKAGAESSLPVGLQLMASRLLDGLCLAAMS